MKTILFSILTLVFTGLGTVAFAQDAATINFYRAEESMMSGGRGLNIKVYMNDKEVGSVQSNTKVIYKGAAAGSTKIKCVALFSTGPVGKPYVETIEIAAGKEYHISLEAGSMFGVKGELLNEKGVKKMAKVKFSDTTTIE